jgi:hypothetical protein
MPLDETLPPSRLPAFPELDQILAHFPAAFGIRVDTDGLDQLPAVERQRYATARPPEPPEAVLLDRVLQLVPLGLLRRVERIVVLPTRGTARPGGYFDGILSLSAAEADARRPDSEYEHRFSVFTTTVVHEIGHAVFETVLSPDEQYRVVGDYLVGPRGRAADELLGDDIQHHFVDIFIAAVLGYGRPPRTAGASRRKLAEFGLDLRRL